MAEALTMQTTRRWWPDGTYCPDGREHLSLTVITTTAPLKNLEAFGAELTEGAVVWCGCSQHAWATAVVVP